MTTAFIAEIGECTFCTHQALVAGGDHRICAACVDLCQTYLADPETGQSQPREHACSFCGLPRHAVRKLVSAPRVFICDACVAAAAATFS